MSLPGHAQRKRFDKDGRCVICKSGLRGGHCAAVCRANMTARKYSKTWDKYTPQMQALARRRALLARALAKAGVWRPGRKLEAALRGLDSVTIKTAAGCIQVLTYRGMRELARRTGVKVPR